MLTRVYLSKQTRLRVNSTCKTESHLSTYPWNEVSHIFCQTFLKLIYWHGANCQWLNGQLLAKVNAGAPPTTRCVQMQHARSKHPKLPGGLRNSLVLWLLLSSLTMLGGETPQRRELDFFQISRLCILSRDCSGCEWVTWVMEFA